MSVEAGALISELKRRRVIRALVGYGIVAFAVLQIIEPVMHGLHWPDEVLSYAVVALAVGFPIVVGLAWIFDVNAGHLEHTAPAQGLTGAKLMVVLVGIGLITAAPGVIWYFAVRGIARRPAEPSGTTSSSAQASIAVLPFADMSPTHDQDYFSDGIAEQILDNLAQVDGLKVIGRTSSFQFRGKGEDLRGIGEKLGVGHVLEGSVRKDGSHVRITAQLIAAADGSHVWSRSYDREMTGIFALQDEIARAVVEALKVKLLLGSKPAARPTESVEAYEHYLLGKHFDESPEPDSWLLKRIQFEKAIALDPRFGLAWAWLAFALKDAAPRAKTTDEILGLQRRSLAAAGKAVEFSPDSAEAFSTRGLMRWWLAGDRDGAHADLARALELNPNDSTAHRRYGLIIASEGRLSEGIAEVRRGIELDPLNPNIWIRIAYLYGANGQIELARQAVAHTVEIEPKYPVEDTLIGLDLVEKPLSALARCARLAVESSRLSCTAAAEAAAGHRTLARQALDSLVRKYPPSDGDAEDMAQIHALLGDKDHAFEWLNRLARLRGESAALVKINPLLRNLHGDPRWPALLKKLSLPLD